MLHRPDTETSIPLRARMLAATALSSGALIAGCGATAGSPAAGGASSTARTSPASATPAGSSTTGSSGSSSPPSPAQLYRDELAFAKCMRANGVTDFPDPKAGSGASFQMPAGADPQAPAFDAAQRRCEKLLPAGALAGPRSGSPPSARTLARLRRIAVCMRRHGFSEFPDPRTSVPAKPPAGVSVITDYDGAILLFPQAIDMQAPAYRQALSACGAPPLGLPH